MKSTALVLMCALASPALAQVEVKIELPTIRFPAPPPLVVIEPGIQVVEDNDDEVFFVDNWYWHRRGKHWFRKQRHDGDWVVVEERVVPGRIVAFAPGHYRRWKGHKNDNGTVVINPPGPGKIKIKEKKGKNH